MSKKIAFIASVVIMVILVGFTIYFMKINTIKTWIVSYSGSSNITGSLTGNLNNPPIQDANITYLISKKDPTKFCDGVNMDSDGFRKTIISEVKSDIPKSGLSQQELAKQISVLATWWTCQTALKQAIFSITDWAVEISPIEGWAWISIAMCSCKPQVEVNLLQLSGIKKVNWLSR